VQLRRSTNACSRDRGRRLRGQVAKNVLDRDLALSVTPLLRVVQINAAELCGSRKDGRLVSWLLEDLELPNAGRCDGGTDANLFDCRRQSRDAAYSARTEAIVGIFGV
jgi:hypothetical protein